VCVCMHVCVCVCACVSKVWKRGIEVIEVFGGEGFQVPLGLDSKQ